MIIKDLTVTNFMGIKGRKEFVPAHINALCAKNGSGKTTFLNALRFALTGLEPAGDLINFDCDECSVHITLTDPISGSDIKFSRIKNRTKPLKCAIDGKATTKKAMDEKIETCIGISLDKIKILSSSEIVAAMKPQEFASFILDYIPEKITLEQVFGYIPSATMGMMDIISANLPEDDISIETLDEFEEVMKSSRKETKASLASKKLILDGMTTEKPTRTRVEVEADLKAVDNVEAEMAIYKANKETYDKAVEADAKQKALIKELSAQRDAITATRPNPAEIDARKKEISDIQTSITNQQTGINGAKTALSTLKATREALDKPVCPISPLIKCTQDKTVAKAEIDESIKTTEEGISALEIELDKSKTSLTAKQAEFDALNRASLEYEKKISLSKQIKTLEDSAITIPAKPVEPKVTDVTAEKIALSNELKAIESYEESLKLSKQIESETTLVSDLEMIVKAFAEKGPVRCGIIDSYLTVFEDICNERSVKYRPDRRFTFSNEDGIVVRMSNDKGSYLVYDNLSGGEKAYMLFILIDMLNSLVGTKLLVLDELSVLDTECFDAMLDTILAYADDYDHIFIAAVDHPDTIESFKKREITLADLSVA